jgi:hypothetical protein
MKRAAFALVFAVVCGSVYAQDADPPNPAEYEELKVLEPMVGTYRSEWSSANTGGLREMLMTFSWSSSKKMLVAEGKIRRAKPGQDISKQPWTTFRTRSYFVWNHVAKRIEMIDVNTLAGAVHVSEVKSKGAGVFSFLPVSSTLNDKAKADMVVTATEEGMTIKFTNRVNADGERLEDAEYTSKRIR